MVKTGVGWWQALEVVRKVGAKLSIPTGKILASKHAFSTLNPVVYYKFSASKLQILIFPPDKVRAKTFSKWEEGHMPPILCPGS